MRQLLDLCLLSFMWGPAFVLMKYALIGFPPVTLVALRVTIAAVLMFLIVKIKKNSFNFSWILFKKSTILGFFSCGCPFVLFAYSIIHIQAIFAGVIVGTVPILTALLAHFFVPEEKLNFNKMMGISLGFSGFIILLLPTLLDAHIDGDTLGLLGCFFASGCYAVGMIYAKKHLTQVPLLVAPTMQLLTVSSYLIPLALILEQPWEISWPTWSAWTSIFALAIFGTAGAFLLYFKIVATYGATILSMVGYLLPIVGTVTGIVFLNEKITPEFFPATGLILSGMYMVNQRSSRTTTTLVSTGSNE